LAELDLREKDSPKEDKEEEPVIEKTKEQEPAVQEEPEKKSQEEEKEQGKETKSDDKHKERKKREPETINPRAAALEAASAHEVRDAGVDIFPPSPSLYSPASIVEHSPRT
jgi:outer membrane biosynthesis protein TonB